MSSRKEILYGEQLNFFEHINLHALHPNITNSTISIRKNIIKKQKLGRKHEWK